jgi:hypothetical protein
MHVGRTAEIRKVAFSVGVVVAALGSLAVLRVLFTRSKDSHGARTRAVLWPPLVGALVGAAADGCMHLDAVGVSLSIAGTDLGGGVSEMVAIALFSAIAGFIGTGLLLPQVVVLARAGEAPEGAIARLAGLAERLAVFVWGVAFGLAALTCVLARPRELDAAVALLVAGVLGLGGQCVRAWQARGSAGPLTLGPYR